MIKILATLCLVSILLFASIEGGKGYYQELCKSCHGNGAVGSHMRTQSGWEAEFSCRAKILKNRHDKNSTAKEIFSADRFESARGDLFEFVREYANDSGNTPIGCE